MQEEMEYQYELKIPKERIAVLIGEKGQTKKMLEKKLHVKIKIDSKEGDVVISGEDSIYLNTTQSIIKAIARGFNPKKTIDLIDDETTFEIIEITDFIGKSKKKLETVRARLIGTQGKARKNLEQLTETKISVYGKTVSIIGYYEDVAIARRAIESLIAGSRHTTIYSWIEKQKNKRMTEKLSGRK